ncbi:hypothetical protein HZS_5595 [Henneguya salminicola]|nr:hypothetical protein HZS_5595 [Henneguya salminicola]
MKNLALDKQYLNPDYNVNEALDSRPAKYSNIVTCRSTDSLHDVIHRLASEIVPRILVLDDNDCLVGVISLSDISRFIVKQNEIII